jgi:succinyl-CoA synthetase beta subunit
VLRPSKGLEEAKKLGIPVPPWSFSPDIPPPAYVKADLPLPHKSEMGAVKRVQNVDDLKAVYDQMKNKFGPVIVQKEVEGEIELLLSVKDDYAFGKVAIISFGGIYASLFKEPVVTLCPICDNVLLRKLSTTKLGKVLEGYRGRVVNKECIVDIISKMCQSNYRVFEINPLLVGPKECWAVDVKLWR